jgi:ABC-type Fe3+-hydroxamate transport system substrate-binding protein
MNALDFPGPLGPRIAHLAKPRSHKEGLSMIRRIACATLALLFVAGLAVAGEAKEATGKVKAVEASSITITDTAAKEMTFVVDKDTTVVAKGASHKMDKLKADGKPTVITEFVAPDKTVTVKYVEKDGKQVAKEVKVK